MPLFITEVTTKGILSYIPQIGTIKFWLSNADNLSVVQSTQGLVILPMKTSLELKSIVEPLKKYMMFYDARQWFAESY